MILRVYTSCPGCDTPTILRIGVAVVPGDQQPFSVRCGNCSATIHGRLITEEPGFARAELSEAPLLSEDAAEEWQVITTHPSFPFTTDTEFSPFIDITNVLGDMAPAFFQSTGQFNGIALGDWPRLERAFEFYFSENWDRFDKTMAQILEEQWPQVPNMVTRHDLIHRLLTSMIISLDPMSSYGDVQNEIWRRAQPSQELVDYVQQEQAQSGFTAIQKRLFRQIEHIVSIRHMWMPVLAYLWLKRRGRDVPDGWRLPGNDFAILRGVYQQNLELSCQALPMLIATQNAADGRPATLLCVDSIPSVWRPPKLSEKTRSPRTLAEFSKARAEIKEAFLDQFPLTEASWFEAFDRRVRNAIAHADTDEVVSTEAIMMGKHTTLSYMDFVETIPKQLQLLLLWLNLAKLFRVYAALLANGSGNPADSG
jgi:hypothetical protein